MSTTITLPPDLKPFKRIRTTQDAKFATFLEFVGRTDLAATTERNDSAFAIEVVKQVNFGDVLSKRYFASAALVPGNALDEEFVEIEETEMTGMKLRKQAFKNFTSEGENLYYELNLYK